MQRLSTYLAPDELWEKSPGEKKGEYVHPRRKQLGCITLVVIREVIAPAVFRNAEEEITDIEYREQIYARAVPNKFKYPERQRGLQILRACDAGGRFPQNRTVVPKGEKPGDAFDLNTLVFGDSANHDNRVLPVRAAVNYSDALSLMPKHQCVEESFHNRAAEDGTLFDAENKKNSDNLFTRHFLRPGTLLVQTLSTRGRVLPLIGLQHLLLSIGLAGSYGGQTAVTGTNIRTRFVGMYGDDFEQDLASPYVLLDRLHADSVEASSPEAVITALHRHLASDHQVAIEGAEVQGWLEDLLCRFNKGELQQAYQENYQTLRDYFNYWFG